jgi:hypothetical protein
VTGMSGCEFVARTTTFWGERLPRRTGDEGIHLTYKGAGRGPWRRYLNANRSGDPMRRSLCCTIPSSRTPDREPQIYPFPGGYLLAQEVTESARIWHSRPSSPQAWSRGRLLEACGYDTAAQPVLRALCTI